MFIRLLFESCQRDFKRKLLAIITIFFAATLISSLLAVSVDIGDQMAKELKSYGANIQIQPIGKVALPDFIESKQNINLSHDYIDEEELTNIKDIFWQNNIVGFAPSVSSKVKLVTAQGKQIPDVSLLGTFFDKKLDMPNEENFHTGEKVISPFWQVEGNWVDDNQPITDQVELLVGSKLATNLNLAIGQKLQLIANTNNLDGKIVGILTTGGDEDQQVIVPLAAAQQLLNLQGKVDNIKVSALTTPENALSRKARQNLDSLTAAEYDIWYCTAYVSTIAKQLEEAISGAVVRPIWQVAAAEGIVIGKIQILLAVVTIAALISSAMGIASLITSSIMERSQEIGLMKAIGSSNLQILLLFYSESVICGILGGLLGCVAGNFLSYIVGLNLFDSPIYLTWIVVPTVVILSILVAILGTWIPALKIFKLHPVDVLYGR